MVEKNLKYYLIAQETQVMLRFEPLGPETHNLFVRPDLGIT